MLDIHSHILPKFDDGSRSTEMTMEMLRMSKQQGVTTIVSTSHFYADTESPDSFRSRRVHARHKIEDALTGDEPEILYGAEVLYYPGIFQSKELAQLHIKGTSLMLIELPFIPWRESIFDELLSFQYNNRLHLIMAHVERYQDIQKRDMFRKLFDRPFYFQCNADVFTYRQGRKLAFEMLDAGLLHFLGTDCHNTTDRAPNMDEARKVIEKKFSPRDWRNLNEDFENRLERHKK